MARQRMVTRTITVNTYTCMGVRLDTATVENITATLNGNPDPKKALALLKSQYDNENFTLVTARFVGTSEVLYGMPEDDFIKLAKPLPPRTSADE